MDAELLCCRQLVCGYGRDPIVGPVDLTLRQAEILAILGGSGSGKSTLLRTLLGLLPPLSGQLQMFGQKLADLEPGEQRKLYRRTGTLFQSDALLGSMTVLENVTLPLRELTDLPTPVVVRLGRARLSLLEILEIEHSTPAQISGGQAKRAALARATILDPEILFCDEPSSGLDPPTAGQIDRILLHFRDVLGTAVITVTHDIESARTISDRALLLGRRGVLAEGKLAELERHPDRDVQRFFTRGASAEISDGSRSPWQ